MNAKSTAADIRVSEIAFTDMGRPDASSLVLIHGNSCAADDWAAQVSHFARSARVVACDLRGHGRSRALPGPFNIEQFALDVAWMVRMLELRDPVMVGHSMGVYVALEVARRRLASLRGLVLIDGAKYESGKRRQVEADFRDRLRRRGYRELVEEAFVQMFGPSCPEPVRQHIIQRASAFSEEIGMEMFPQVVGWAAEHLPDALRSVHVPVLVLQATVVNVDGRRRSLAASDDSTWLQMCRRQLEARDIEIILDCGHFAMIERPAEVNRHIERFLAALLVTRSL